MGLVTAEILVRHFLVLSPGTFHTANRLIPFPSVVELDTVFF